MRQGNGYLRAASFHPDLSRQHQSPVACHAEWAGQQVGGQVEGQQVGGQEKNGQQYQLSSPIVWFVQKHYSTQGSRAITQPSTKLSPIQFGFPDRTRRGTFWMVWP